MLIKSFKNTPEIQIYYFLKMWSTVSHLYPISANLFQKHLVYRIKLLVSFAKIADAIPQGLKIIENNIYVYSCYDEQNFSVSFKSNREVKPSSEIDGLQGEKRQSTPMFYTETTARTTCKVQWCNWRKLSNEDKRKRYALSYV